MNKQAWVRAYTAESAYERMPMVQASYGAQSK